MIARSQRQFARPNQAAILPGQPYRFAARRIDQFNNLFVDLTR